MSSQVIVANVSSDALAKQDAWIAKRDGILERSGKISAVETDADLEMSGWVQAQMSTLTKEIERARLEVTRPLDEVKKQIMAAEKDMCARLSTEFARIKKLNDAYATKKQAEAEAERARIEAIKRAAAEQEAREQMERERAAREEADRKRREAEALFGAGAVVDVAPVVEPAPAPALPPVPEIIPRVSAPSTGSNSFVTTFKFEIVDAAKVPREFCTVDESKIRSAVQYHKSQGRKAEEIIIDGVRVYSEVSTQAKRRF